MVVLNTSSENQIFSTLNTYKMHVKSKHKMNINMSKHIILNEEVKRHICQYCNKETSRQQNLKNHEDICREKRKKKNISVSVIQHGSRVRTNTKFSNGPSTEYVFENEICTNRIPSNYLFRKNYSNSIRVPKTTRIVRKNE